MTLSFSLSNKKSGPCHSLISTIMTIAIPNFLFSAPGFIKASKGARKSEN